jgi:hypothetical protein
MQSSKIQSAKKNQVRRGAKALRIRGRGSLRFEEWMAAKGWNWRFCSQNASPKAAGRQQGRADKGGSISSDGCVS